MSPVPCNCCPVDPQVQRCALVAARFDAVAETSPGAFGWSPPIAIGLTIDGTTTSAALSGYNSQAGPPQPTPVLEYTCTVARDLVRGVRLWNQCGSNLNDADGLGPTTAVEFLDAANTVLHATTLNAGNGAPPFSTMVPGGQYLAGVKTVRLSNLGKLSGSVVAPLWREFSILQHQPVFPCRRLNGALEWYSQDGTLVPAADIVDCL